MHSPAFYSLFCLLPCTGLGLLSPVAADTLTVCSSGCDHADIQSAIDAAFDGDVIEIAAGTYRPGSTLDTLGKAITLQGAVDASGDPLTIVDGDADLDGWRTDGGARARVHHRLRPGWIRVRGLGSPGDRGGAGRRLAGVPRGHHAVG